MNFVNVIYIWNIILMCIYIYIYINQFIEYNMTLYTNIKMTLQSKKKTYKI